jgi:hypothetical protein
MATQDRPPRSSPRPGVVVTRAPGRRRPARAVDAARHRTGPGRGGCARHAMPG